MRGQHFTLCVPAKGLHTTGGPEKGPHRVAYGPGKGLLTAYGLVRLLLNGPGKG